MKKVRFIKINMPLLLCMVITIFILSNTAICNAGMCNDGVAINNKIPATVKISIQYDEGTPSPEYAHVHSMTGKHFSCEPQIINNLFIPTNCRVEGVCAEFSLKGKHYDDCTNDVPNSCRFRLIMDNNNPGGWSVLPE